MNTNPFQRSLRLSRKILSTPHLGTWWTIYLYRSGERGEVIGLRHVRENGDVLITARFADGNEITYSYNSQWTPNDAVPADATVAETHKWNGSDAPVAGSWWFDMVTRAAGPVLECRETDDGKDLRIVFYPMEGDGESGRITTGANRSQVVSFLREWKKWFVRESDRGAPPPAGPSGSPAPTSPATNDTRLDESSSIESGSAGDGDATRPRGVVRRADGRELARVAVYIDPADAMRFKLWCAKNGREMSEELAPTVAGHIRGLAAPEPSAESRCSTNEPTVLWRMKVRKSTRRALRLAAAARGMTMKRYLLTLAATAGVAIVADDLKAQHDEEDEDDAPPPASAPSSPAPVAVGPAASSPASSGRAVVQRKDGRELRRKTTYLPPELAARLDVYAARTQRDQSDVAAEALEEWLKKAVGQ